MYKSLGCPNVGGAPSTVLNGSPRFDSDLSGAGLLGLGQTKKLPWREWKSRIRLNLVANRAGAAQNALKKAKRTKSQTDINYAQSQVSTLFNEVMRLKNQIDKARGLVSDPTNPDIGVHTNLINKFLNDANAMQTQVRSLSAAPTQQPASPLAPVVDTIKETTQQTQQAVESAGGLWETIKDTFKIDQDKPAQTSAPQPTVTLTPAPLPPPVQTLDPGQPPLSPTAIQQGRPVPAQSGFLAGAVNPTTAAIGLGALLLVLLLPKRKR